MNEQAKVREFMHSVKHIDLPVGPTIPPPLVARLCVALIEEELSELREHMHDAKDIVAIADDLADLLYVVYYAANACGLIMSPIFDEVHRSNMTKMGGPLSETGKQLKPASYEPPLLEPLVRAQMAGQLPTARLLPISYKGDEPRAYIDPTGRITGPDAVNP